MQMMSVFLSAWRDLDACIQVTMLSTGASHCSSNPKVGRKMSEAAAYVLLRERQRHEEWALLASAGSLWALATMEGLHPSLDRAFLLHSTRH